MRRSLILVMTLLMTFGSVSPAHAHHGEDIDGMWIAVDETDGSRMRVTITESDPDRGLFTVEQTDTHDNIWGTKATKIATEATYDNNPDPNAIPAEIDGEVVGVLNVTWQLVEVRGKFYPLDEPRYEIFWLLAPDGVMVDDTIEHNLWYHVSG